MRPPTEKEALRQIEQRLIELLGEPKAYVRRHDHRIPGVDAVIQVGEATFVVEYKGSGATAPVSVAIDTVQRYASASKSAIPLVVVPFMGPVGRKRCENAHVAWLDLSGNARIFAPGIRVSIEGHRNKFKSPGRPFSAFAPKSARITRWLLMHPQQSTTQREIAQATDMDEGFTSRIVSRLEEDNLVVRDPNGSVRVSDPDRLLDAWREDYDFAKHQVFRGSVAARSGEDALRLLEEGLQNHGERYAATGLGAAWLLTKFAIFRLATIYVGQPPTPALLNRLGFREETRGANVWLVVPRDEGVFHGARERGGVVCVHPVQAYVDLKDQPERAKEAADHLRTELLKWTTN